MRSPSDPYPLRALRRLAAVVAIGVVLLPFPGGVPSLAQSSQVIIQAGFTQPEDLYAFAQSVIVEGTIEGDLFVVTGSLTITGRVEGDVLGLVWGTSRIAGTVDGSVRLAGYRVETAGEIADDLALAAPFADVGGRVGRDLFHFTGALDVAGTVVRGVHGMGYDLDLEGTVERDVDVSVRRLSVAPGAVVGGDLVYRSAAGAVIDPGATVAGQIVRTEPHTPIELRVVRRVITIVGLLGFLFGGMALLWALRGTTARAATAARGRTMAALGIGAAVLVGIPVAIALLAVTLAGLPVALVLAGLYLAVLFFGPLPAVSVVGGVVLGGRGGLVGAIVAGTVLWRAAAWIVPWVGGFLYLALLVWGTGAWVLGAWEARRAAPPPPDDFFAAPPAPRAPVIPAGWEPPLAPDPTGRERAAAGLEVSPEAGDRDDAAARGSTGRDDDTA